MLKILQAGLQQYMNQEIPVVQAGFRKGRRTRDQIANIGWIIEKVREFPQNIYFCFIDYAKAFDCLDHNKLWKILQEMGLPDHLTCLLRNLYAGQESTVIWQGICFWPFLAVLVSIVVSIPACHAGDRGSFPWQGGNTPFWASLVAQRLTRLPAMQETWFPSLGQEDPLEKEMATHSSILA